MSRSIASMTGGSRVAQGATLVTTCRADKDSARQIAQQNVKDPDLNVAKYELCLAPSLKRAKTDAYCNVMSKDPSCPVGNQSCKMPLPTNESGIMEDYKPLTGLGVNKIDNSISSYYRDWYDARSELELYLVTHQISLHVNDDGLKAASKEGFIGLQYFNGFLSVDGETVPSGASKPAPGCCRKHPVIFCNAANYATYKTSHSGGNEVEKDFAYVIDKRTLIINLEKLDKNNFTTQMMDLFNTVYESTTHVVGDVGESVPSVNTPKNPSGFGNSIEPSTWTFQGFSLGSAYMDQRDGDNCFSVLRSGAFTVRNGPFHINSGDELMWIRHKELVCFNREGYRHIRPVATLEAMQKCCFVDGYRAKIEALYLSMVASVNQSANQAMVQRGKMDPAGDHTTILRTYIIAPIRTSYKSVVKHSSVMDQTRRIGSAISNAGGGVQVDVLVGSDI